MKRALFMTCASLFLLVACAEKQTQVERVQAMQEVRAAEPLPPPSTAPIVMLVDLETDELVEHADYTSAVRRGLLQSSRAFVAVRSELMSLLEDCESDACQQRVQQISAAPYVVSGGLSRVGKRYVVRLQLLHASGQVLARVLRQAASNPEALAFAAGRELAESLPQPQNE